VAERERPPNETPPDAAGQPVFWRGGWGNLCVAPLAEALVARRIAFDDGQRGDRV